MSTNDAAYSATQLTTDIAAFVATECSAIAAAYRTAVRPTDCSTQCSAVSATNRATLGSTFRSAVFPTHCTA
jgi:hypothetical protein